MIRNIFDRKGSVLQHLFPVVMFWSTLLCILVLNDLNEHSCLLHTSLIFDTIIQDKWLNYDYLYFVYFRDEKKCEKEKVQKCNKEPKTVKKEVHKRVPTSIEGKIAYRVCPGKKDHEYTPTETREMNFTGY